jgi:hypothetical protein
MSQGFGPRESTRAKARCGRVGWFHAAGFSCGGGFWRRKLSSMVFYQGLAIVFINRPTAG